MGKATGEIIAVFHTPVATGAHILRKSCFNHPSWEIHSRDCALVRLPHQDTGVGINYDSHHDGSPEVLASFLAKSQVIAKVVKGHALNVLEAKAKEKDGPPLCLQRCHGRRLLRVLRRRDAWW